MFDEEADQVGLGCQIDEPSMTVTRQLLWEGAGLAGHDDPNHCRGVGFLQVLERL